MYGGGCYKVLNAGRKNDGDKGALLYTQFKQAVCQATGPGIQFSTGQRVLATIFPGTDQYRFVRPLPGEFVLAAAGCP
jgi:hypothetical protein